MTTVASPPPTVTEAELSSFYTDPLADTVLALLAWQQVKALGRHRLLTLAQTPNLASDLWHASPTVVQHHLHLKEASLVHWQQLRCDATLWQRLAAPFVANPQLACLTWQHTAYPEQLRHSPQPPALLYVKGAADVLASVRWLAVVGTRQSTPYGQSLTAQLVEGLAGQPLGIVSGLAAGIDTFAHEAALAAHLPTVAFFGCGLSTIYPSSNRQLANNIVASGGALISEYPFTLPPHGQLFPQRNRLIAGLCEAVIVVEAGDRSGAMQTGRLALDANRDVMAVPGACHWPQSQGPLALIRQGATPVWQPAHVLEVLNLEPLAAPLTEASPTDLAHLPAPTPVEPLPQLQAKPAKTSSKAPKNDTSPPQEASPSLTPEALPTDPQQQAILQRLSLTHPILLDELIALCGLPITEIQTCLTLLELEGWLHRPTSITVQRLR